MFEIAAMLMSFFKPYYMGYLCSEVLFLAAFLSHLGISVFKIKHLQVF